MTTSRCSRLALIVALAVAAGCSKETPLPPESAGVYARLLDARRDFETGVRLIAAGDDVAGQNLLAAATTRLTVAARECAATPACDDAVITATAEDLALHLRDPGAGPGEEPALAPAIDEAGDADDGPFEPALSTEIEPVSLLRGADLSELIPLNTRVLAQLNAWLTWKRPDLIEAVTNYGYLRGRVAPVYEAADLPEALLFGIMATESGVKVHAYSRAGASGPLQFMPATARRYGLGSIDGFDARLDPESATAANTRYLHDQLRRFRGNLELTLAAYNAGESRMARLQRRLPGRSFWDPDVYYALPLETRTYVPRVLAAAWLFLHPEDYGLTLPQRESTVTRVRLPAAASLGELAICLGNDAGDAGWFRTLRNLNPAVSAGDRMPAGARIAVPTAVAGTFAARCVDDAPTMAIARRLHDADYPEQPDVIEYTVRRGDTLAAIAQEHRSSVREMARLNDVRGPNYVIHPGQRLQVPARQ